MTSLRNHTEAATSPSISRRLFLSTGRVSVYQAVGLLLAFGLQTLISRHCGPAAVGVYTLFSSWLVILSVITVPGLESCVVYFLPRLEKDRVAQRLVVRISLFFTGALSLLFGGILAGLGNRLIQWIGLPAAARHAFAFALIFFSIGRVLDAVFLGRKDAPLISYYNIIRLGIRIVLCLPILVYPAAAWNIIFFAIAAETAATAALRFFRIQKRYDGLVELIKKETPASITTKTIVRTSFPMLGISVIDTVSPFLDKAILGLLVPLTLVGIYRISEYVSSLNTLFVAPFVAFWPFISSLSAERRLGELGAAYKNITLAIIALMLPFSLALFELSGFVLSLFGPAFAAQGSTIFVVLAVGTLVDAIAGPAGAVLRLADHYRLSLAINSVLLIVYCAATVLLARAHGILGAAIARSVTLILGNVINVVANWALLKVFPYTMKHAALILCGAGILILRIYLLPLRPGLHMHFAIASAEAMVFACCALFILRTQVQRVPSYLRAFVSIQG